MDWEVGCVGPTLKEPPLSIAEDGAFYPHILKEIEKSINM
jgi:hypothetical protein